MERVLSNEERIRRAEVVAIRRRIRENGNEKIKDSAFVNNATPRKKISKLAKFSIQVISSICIFGIVYYLGQNYSQTINNVKPFFEHDTDIVKQASDIYNMTKSIFTGENLNYWRNKWRNE
jgi:hypothetical protein